MLGAVGHDLIRCSRRGQLLETGGQNVHHRGVQMMPQGNVLPGLLLPIG